MRSIEHKTKLLSTALMNNEGFQVITTLNGDILYTNIKDSIKLRLFKKTIHKYHNQCTSMEHYTFIEKLDSFIISGDSKILTIDQFRYVYYTLEFNQENDKHRLDYINIMNRSSTNTPLFLLGNKRQQILLDDIRETVESYASQRVPVVLLGERYTGKDIVAQYLYEKGPYHNNNLYIINCKKFDKHTEDNRLLMEILSGLKNTTLYLKNLNDVSEERYQCLIDILSNSDITNNNRIIISLKFTDGDSKNSLVLGQLSEILPIVTLYIAPLRERKEGIQSLASIYINQFNIETGSNVIGFEPKVLSSLKKFPWPDNLLQFSRVLRNLVIQTKDFYISQEQVKDCLYQEELMLNESSVMVANQLNLNQPLDNIIYDIVQQVMINEHHNQTKAAERLGIGRSTIWRILKSKS